MKPHLRFFDLVKTSSFYLFKRGLETSFKGMMLTISHLRRAIGKQKIQSIKDKDFFEKKEGIATLSYPYESIPVPDHGRYQLFNEIEDCIVCDKCAKICPVDCIDIEPIKSVGEFGKTSDGTPKRIYAAKFDIDMAKCCFCGLCTTVCPTECLTMTDEYDFSVFDLGKMNFGFGNMTESEAASKRLEWEENQQKKANLKSESQPLSINNEAKPVSPIQKRPMRPTIPINNENLVDGDETAKTKDFQAQQISGTEAMPDPIVTKFTPRMRPVVTPKPPIPPSENV